jgi:hypothetical protein
MVIAVMILTTDGVYTYTTSTCNRSKNIQIISDVVCCIVSAVPPKG